MTVNLIGVTDVQQITVTLTGVTSSDSQVLPATSVSMNVLIGDVNADKTVNNRDVRLTRDQIGMPVTAANFRQDINVNGSTSQTMPVPPRSRLHALRGCMTRARKAGDLP